MSVFASACILMVLGWEVKCTPVNSREMELNLEGREDLFEGDILLTEEQWRNLRERQFITSSGYKWPEDSSGFPLVQYRFTDTTASRPKIGDAINFWRGNTCIKFEQIDSVNGEPHLVFVDDVGCYSYVGRIAQFASGQNVSLPADCTQTLGTPTHEIAHALGSYHEQSRSDRDSFVYILFGNIQPDRKNNFDKHSTFNYDQLYDYSSVMHYGTYFFQLQTATTNLDTIRTVDPRWQGMIGQREGPSFKDVKTVNVHYDCNSKWMAACSITSNPCQNDGYIGGDCECVCPDGTIGTNCENKIKEYLEARAEILAPGTERITTEGTIESLSYPTQTARTSMVKHIVAPACHQVVATFNDFKLREPITFSDGRQWCYFQSLQILYNWGANEPENKYCDTDLEAPNNVVTSDTNEMILVYVDNDGVVSSVIRGFSADITFQRMTTPECELSSSTAPSTTDASSTTGVPSTTDASSTTSIPSTTDASSTTGVPSTTDTSSTTGVPSTTDASSTTGIPSTTDTSSTTGVPSTTGAPSTIIINTGLVDLTVDTAGDCKFTKVSDTTFTIASPGYPELLTDAGKICNAQFATSEPRYLKATLTDVIMRRRDDAYLYYPRNRAYVLRTVRTGKTLKIITASARLEYTSTKSRTGQKFLVTMEVINNQDCHKIIQIAEGDNGVISIGDPYPADTHCEWWLEAPTGKQVQLEFSQERFTVGFRLFGFSCRNDYLLIDITGDVTYTTDTSRYCGSNNPGTVKSKANKMNLAVWGTRGRYTRFEATYSVV